MRLKGDVRAFALAFGVSAATALAQTPSSPSPAAPGYSPLVAGGPIVGDASGAPRIASAELSPADRVLPINLATALRLADARPLLIQAAEAAVTTEFGRLQQARALWLPSLNLGANYTRHDGAAQSLAEGRVVSNSRNEFLLGVGPRAIFALTDAIYAPLVAEQVVRAREWDVQAARNDALLDVAEAYFLVQESRGRLAGLQDVVEKARGLEERIDRLGKDLAPPFEVERARTTQAEFEQQLARARRDWRIASARLTRVLRLNPTAVAEPLEPPQLKVTLIPPSEPVDNMIPVALTQRPELSSQQAIVQATLAALRRERMRPLIPSLVLEGSAVPGQRLAGGLYAAGPNSSLGQATSRSDINLQIFWEFQNLGFGNRGRVTEARGEQARALIELFRVQDRIAEEVAQVHAELESATTELAKAEAGLRSAQISYEGNFRGLSETIRQGDILVLVSRPLDAVAALLQLQQAYSNYYIAVNQYNRAQFRLFRALGYPANMLACSDAVGPVQPVDTSRPPPLPTIPEP